MNTIISSKKLSQDSSNKNMSETSIKKIKTNLTLKSNEKNSINDITNSSQESRNSLEKCEQCHKYEKEVESLAFLKLETERKYQEEKLKNKLLQKKYKNDTTLSTNELNSTISSLRQDILKKDVEIKHLQEQAMKYKNKYDKTLSQFESEKNNFISNEEKKNNQKNQEIQFLINNTNNQMLGYAKENTELIGKINFLSDEKCKLEQENIKLKADNDNYNAMVKKLSQINNELKCDKNLLMSEIEGYKREIGIIKENLENKIKENNDNFKKNELLKQDSSKNLFIAVNKQQELIETEINFEKLKNENMNLKNIIENLNNNVNYMKNAKNVNDLLLAKHINENKILIQENNELKQRIKYIEQEYNKIKKEPKKDSNFENDLQNKNNILINENNNQLDEINKLISQNEFLKNYYFNHENELIKQKNAMNNNSNISQQYQSNDNIK